MDFPARVSRTRGTSSSFISEVDCGLKFSADVPPEWIIDCEQVAEPSPPKDMVDDTGEGKRRPCA
jgi:hypothetical protein